MEQRKYHFTNSRKNHHINTAIVALGFQEKLRDVQPGWDETNFLGRDRDREIGLIENQYETETEK